MGSFLDRATQAGDQYGDALKACEPYLSKYPCLHAILAGEKPTPTNPGREPGSVRIFTNGGEMRASIGGKNWLYTGYLELPQRVMTLADIEDALKAEKIGWKLVDVRKPSF